MVECSFIVQVVVRWTLVALTEISDFATPCSQEFFDSQSTIECGFTLKHVRDMINTYSKMHCTDKYS